MHFSELAKWVGRIERELARQYATVRRRYPDFALWTGLVEEFTLRGGKRFRALLVLGGYGIATHESPAPALPAAAALEHFQSWMLIHDDIMDHADTRRGGPTLHRALEGEHRRERGLGPPENYGLGGGITLGDLEEPFTVEALLASRASAPRRLAALAEFVRMTRETAFGQMLDIRGGARPLSEVTPEAVRNVHRLKTAVYTVAAPLRIGAILGGGPAGLLRDLDAIGLDLGVAFQLRDDVLGVGFSASDAGKSANDLAEGKRTLLVLEAWRASDGAGRAEIESVLGHPDAAPDRVDAVRERIRSTGALEASEEAIRKLTERAYRRIDRSRYLRSGDRELLREIGDRLTQRAQ